MDSQTELTAVDRAMRSYYAAVSQGDAAAVARHFTAPAMFVTQRGAWSPTTTAQIEASFVSTLRDFKAQGYSHSTWAESHMKLLGETTALASLVVVRHRTDGTEIGTLNVGSENAISCPRHTAWCPPRRRVIAVGGV
jgi:ketosteroid isomerase-like protein